jgi:hypothetical protein
MGELAENIRRAVREERYVIGDHADERLKERRIVDWQVVVGLEGARLLRERKDALPNPTAEFEAVLTDGTPVKAIWAWIPQYRMAKLVTVHFFPRIE